MHSLTCCGCQISETFAKARDAQSRRHRSEAELIREAIDQLLADEPERPRPSPPQLDLDPAVIDNLDEHLSAGFGADGLEGASWRS